MIELKDGRLALTCGNCGHYLIQMKVTDAEFQKSKDVPLRIKVPVCLVCSNVKKTWRKSCE